MNEEWWENPVRFICGYWWIFLILLVLGLAAYFTRTYWMPLLGLGFLSFLGRV